MKIAFLGLGNMGAHMARNLLQAKHEVAVWNRTTSKAEPLRAHNALVAASIAEAVRGAEVVVTMMADDHAVSSAVLGPDGILRHLSAGGIHISMSTISVALSQQLAAEHEKKGQHYVSAPVFGRPEAASAAKLFVVAAGESPVLDRCSPIFAAVGQRTFLVGAKPEMANVVKLAGNFMISTVIESLGESIALTRKYGIAPQEFVELLTSTLFAAPVYKTYGGLIAEERYQPAGFAMRLGLKDVRLVAAAADSAGVPMPFLSVVHDNAVSALGRGMQELDWSALGRLAAENAGLK
jgi:3-hydroxyisobutyrate dehydrogenase-like beta-hydroxyacid dehydrogenase